MVCCLSSLIDRRPSRLSTAVRKGGMRGGELKGDGTGDDKRYEYTVEVRRERPLNEWTGEKQRKRQSKAV